ncbi:hypothetical protein TSAR_013110 [Trichomalopsis sarcophagae]|uniref:Uncharacterized protein n=1 Tax=Trichomalopsis sarcophagae TaxID=543379 RepID=A0A232ERJ2_9HYME|nr:hypothetical protein TSAR_013110 [Trichomalopsis sarcophagae]
MHMENKRCSDPWGNNQRHAIHITKCLKKLLCRKCKRHNRTPLTVKPPHRRNAMTLDTDNFQFDMAPTRELNATKETQNQRNKVLETNFELSKQEAKIH